MRIEHCAGLVESTREQPAWCGEFVSHNFRQTKLTKSLHIHNCRKKHIHMSFINFNRVINTVAYVQQAFCKDNWQWRKVKCQGNHLPIYAAEEIVEDMNSLRVRNFEQHSSIQEKLEAQGTNITLSIAVIHVMKDLKTENVIVKKRLHSKVHLHEVFVTPSISIWNTN